MGGYNVCMKKYYQALLLANLSVELEDPALCPPDLARTKINVHEAAAKKPTASTSLPASLRENRLVWEESLELRFTGQQKLAFEVYCSAQQNAWPEPLFQGVYYIDTSQLPRKDSCHVYSPEGEKQGVLRWEVSMATRQEEEVREEKVEIEKPLIPQGLIGVIRIFEATLEISNPVFSKKKHPNPTLNLNFGEQLWSMECSGDYSWRFQDVKLDYFPQSSQNINFSLLQDNAILLQGSLSCDGVRKLKRYVRHSVSLFNRHQIKVGSLNLELRYLDSEELIGFIYSPQNNPNFTKRPNPIKPLQHKQPPPRSGGEIMRRNQSFLHESRSKDAPSRYAAHNSEALFPKTTRFSASKAANPYVSYIDPEKLSDFAPKRKRGWDMSLGRKFDFTRQYRGNPGVGSYRLPSIFEH